MASLRRFWNLYSGRTPLPDRANVGPLPRSVRVFLPIVCHHIRVDEIVIGLVRIGSARFDRRRRWGLVSGTGAIIHLVMYGLLQLLFLNVDKIGRLGVGGCICCVGTRKA